VRRPTWWVDHEELVDVLVRGPSRGREDVTFAEAKQVRLPHFADVDTLCEDVSLAFFLPF
jgi:hypothetical protein